MLAHYETSDEIRLRHARLLVKSLGAGGISEIARRLKCNQVQISQMMGKNPSRVISNKLAREFEAVFGLPRGWLDNPWLAGQTGINALYDSILIQWQDIASFKESPLSKITGCTCFRVQVITGILESCEIECEDPWPRIPFGSEIVVDTALQPEHRQLVVFQPRFNDEPTMGQYQKKTGVVTFDKDAPVLIPLTEEVVINGVICQVNTTETLVSQ